MKKIWILTIALLCGFLCRVNAQGVQFRDLTFRQGLEQAQKENKLLFVDCYTSWCGLCKNMLANVFPLPEAGEFMNAAFVCVKFDMERGEGIELRKKFGVRAYPTFFIVRPDGTEQHKLVGGSKWDRFRTRLERGLDENTCWQYLDERYEKGKLSGKQYAAYAQALKDAGDRTKLEHICRERFAQLGEKAKSHKDNWFLFDQEMSPTDERFVFLVEHKEAFNRSVPSAVLDERIQAVYSDALIRLEREDAGNWPQLAAVIADQLKKMEFEGKQQISHLLDYEIALRSKNIEGILKSLEEGGEKMPQRVDLDFVLRCGFIVREGTPEQAQRYIRLGRNVQKRAATPEMSRLIDEQMDQYESDLNNRSVFATIKGKVMRERMKELRLYKVQDGKEVPIATSKVSCGGWYGFTFHPEQKGFYTLGGDDNLDRIRLYIKPGDRGEVNFPEDTIVITPRNTPENLLLARWEAMMIPVRKRVDDTQYALFDYRDFFPYFMDFLPQAREFQQKLTFRDQEFARLVRQTVDFDLDYYAFRILNALKAGKETHKPSRPTPADYPAYYATIISADKLTDASILKQPYGYDFLQRYTTFALGKEVGKATLADRLEWLPDNLLKAEIILWYAENCRTYEDYIKIVRKYDDYLTNESHRERMNVVSARLYRGEKGEMAADFTYPDRNGKLVSLSDFKGKVVVVDVWATWCGPCRAEIPHLVKLEKEMHGKDVVFIGVSVDQKKDREKWLDVLDREGLGGVQLFTGGWPQLAKDYKIKGIPRFMVFDREGRVVTTKSPRPSNPELKKLLEKLLK